ncbi:hypothetical protein WN944_014370 [Citrus x changshan-huyou]|uniref:RRM domain-containing protein n=1 Tax=Citrus x changshan-huyou TaxID=2935761 RepID=A0AAP0M7R4_9ROSI
MAAQSLIQTRKIQQFNSYFTEDSLLSFSSKVFSLCECVSFSTTKEMLADAFSQFGQVTEATIKMDIGKNRSKGYGYVTSSTEEEAQKALVDMNGKLLDGRVIFVDNVRPSRRYNADASLARQPAQSPEEN